MYKNLKAEMARNEMNITQLGERAGIPMQRLSGKISGKSVRGFLFTEVCSIKKALNSDMALEELFEK